MKKLLLISYHFPPDAAIGAVRPAKFAQHLSEFGWEPVILTVKERHYKDRDPERMDHLLNVLNINRVSPLPGPLQLYSILRQGLLRVTGAGETDGVRKHVNQTVHKTQIAKGHFRRFVSSFLRLPDECQGWIINVALSGYRIVKRESIDVFLTSGPPMSTHIGGLLIQKMTNVRWVADFRDPWTSMLDWEDNTYRSEWGNYIDRWLEWKVIKAADRVVCTAPSVTRYFQSLLPENQKEKVITITNGYDDSDFANLPQVKSTDPKLRICYAGSLYMGRNPEPLFRSLSVLVKKGRVNRDEVELQFIGAPYYNGHHLSALAQNHGLAGMVRLTGSIPFDECLRKMAAANGLLLFAQGQPQCIPGKVFEYLRMNKPTLAIVDEGDTKDLLSSFPNFVIADADKSEQMEEKVLQMIHAMKENRTHKEPNHQTKQYERRRLTGRLSSLLRFEAAKENTAYV